MTTRMGTRQEQSRQDWRWGRVENIAYWLVLLAGCAVFLLMNLYTTVKEDDLFHATIGGGSTRPIDSLLDVLRSWVAYYKYDARTANLISFTFNGILGKTIFNVCNTLVFGLMAHLLSRAATHRNSVMALVMLYTYMVTAMPVPGETLLWETGSFNYMWNLTASLLFVAYLFGHRDSRPGWLKGALVLLLSLLAGGINEGTTFGVFGGLVIYFLFHRDRVDRAVVIAMTGYLLGVLLLLTCPGAWDRASLEVSHDAGLMSLLTERCRLTMSVMLRYVTPLAAILVLLVGPLKSSLRKTLAASPWPWIFLVQLAFVFVIGKDQSRLFFPVSMTGFILVVMALYKLLERLPWLRLAVIAVGVALCVKCYPANLRTMKQYQAFFDGVENSIRQSPDTQVILPTQTFNAYTRFVKPFNFDSWSFFIREETLCRHYGKDNIQFVPDSICERYRQGTLLDGAQAMPFTSPDCPEVKAVWAVSRPDFVAVETDRDTICHSYQFAHAFKADGTSLPPVGYFPLLYQGKQYLIFAPIAHEVARLTFIPFALEGTPITLSRTAAIRQPEQ